MRAFLCVENIKTALQDLFSSGGKTLLQKSHERHNKETLFR